jgi:hypothetical protein
VSRLGTADPRVVGWLVGHLIRGAEAPAFRPASKRGSPLSLSQVDAKIRT